jgi:hypothetical protein
MMGLFAAVTPALQALQIGKELKNAAGWKNAQTIGLLLSSLLSIAAAFGVDFGITSEHVLGIAGAIAAVAAYLVPATSARVGVGARGATSRVLPPSVRHNGGADSQSGDRGRAFDGDH